LSAAPADADVTADFSGNISVAPVIRFDGAAAARAVAAVSLGECKKSGAAGSGHLTLTFATNGTCDSAAIDKGPLMGTAAGDCVAAQYRKVRVAPFSGNPVKVGTNFSLD
jgi:hypothetical protein